MQMTFIILCESMLDSWEIEGLSKNTLTANRWGEQCERGRKIDCQKETVGR